MCREYKLACLNGTGAVTCYPASTMNLIWFADKEMFIVSALSSMGTWNQVFRELETQPSRNLCVLVHCLARSCNQQQKSSYSSNCVKLIFLGDFCGCSGKTLTICQQRSTFKKTKFTIKAKQLLSNWQHQLRQASLYSRHIITSVLHHD